MEINVPPGFNVERFGGSGVTPGARIHLRRLSDKADYTGFVQHDGTLELREGAPPHD